jgi:mannose-6-phosphate isomerase-like protein (cupin superfamily)
MRDVPAVDLAPGVHVRTVVGATGSFSFGEFDSGSAAVLHHHTREQADVGITGVFDMTIGGHVEPLGPGAGVIVPANVAHSIKNLRDGVMTVIEFHTVRRPDLVPPRPAMTFPSAPQPVAVPDNRALVADLAARGTMHGQTCRLAWRVLSRGAKPTDLHPMPTRVEQYIYVVRGDADLTAAGQTQRIGAGTLVVIPAAEPHVRMQAAGPIDVALAEFSPSRS